MIWPRSTTTTAISLTAVPSPSPACRASSTSAKMASTEFTATQPDAESQLMSAAGKLPLSPKAALVLTIVAVPVRGPKTLQRPSTAEPATPPTATASSACQRLRPKSTVRAAVVRTM